MRSAINFRYVTGAVLIQMLCLSAVPVLAQKRNTPSSLLNYAKTNATTVTDGYMVAGELWDTIKPLNTAETNSVEDPRAPSKHFLTFGPDGTNWLNPSGHWPGGWNIVPTFRDGRRMTFPVFEGDGWGPNVIQAGGGTDDRFAFAYYTSSVAGAGDPNRNYTVPAHFTNEARTHLVYEAGWPTNVGIDFRIRAHQYTSNEQNLNDFIAVEISMTNTGEVDIDGDGTVEMSNHAIDAVTSALWYEPAMSVRINANAGRTNVFGAGRSFGYAGAVDPVTGEPYDITYMFANVPDPRYAGGIVPAPGERLIGVNEGRFLTGYTDVWTGQRFVAVKQGAITPGDAGIGAISATSPDKMTLFGTHPVGVGAQKGWFGANQFEGSLFSFNESERAFRSATAQWYSDYGKTSTTAEEVDLSPNPAFFSAGTADDVTTFVPNGSNSRPDGDIKYAIPDLNSPPGGRGNEEPVWEDGLLETAGDFYSAIGFTKNYTFGQSPSIGNGPYSLEVGESITVVFVLSAGYRFDGLAGANRAAEWAWGQGWDISSSLPVPPAPELNVESTTNGSALVRWTDVASIASAVGTSVDGYKIYRAARFQREDWLDNGFRGVDEYHKVHEVGGDLTPLLEPVNPYFDAAAEFVGSVQGTYQPDGWGPYTLIAKIPNGDLSQYADASGGYDYAYEDTDAITGFTYWYYVAAYRDGTFTGPQGATSSHIESSNFTRNGRNDPAAANGVHGSGTPWGGTYPFAVTNNDFPSPGTQEFKNMGGEFKVTPPVANTADVERLVTVSPNPYVRTGLNDERDLSYSHNVNFLNLPGEYTLTILDVSGQVVFQVEEAAAVDGQFTWNMQSKDGLEVASGLYIFHVEFNGGSATGHFAILR